jgi:uncharacterized protein YndB with AHSA1/START domain
MEARAYGRDRREWRFKGTSAAPPEVVYDVIADPAASLEWAGKRQYKMFRLLSVDAPSGPAEVGTKFSSIGTIPMNSARFHNENTVTSADRPRTLEVTTEGRIPWKKRAPGDGTFINRFEITPHGGGSRVVYVAKQLRFRNPPWGLRYPVLRNITYRMWIPIWFRRGFKNLLEMAAERTREASGAVAGPGA